ncbi:MAG: UbiD family decarboxylase [Candidatus Korobacteraceae bacterium]|jgi:2,5-furandicarboxylate decarboxylase 1
MTITSMRQWLAVLAEEKLLKVVNRKVSLQHELAAVGKRADGRWALQFNHPEDFDIPVVTGIAGSRALIAKAMRVAVPCVSEHFFWAQTHPSACETVDRASAPVKEVITTAVDLGRLPIPVHHEKDGGRYITAGLLVSKDPSTGARNVSIHRLQVLGPDRLGILILPRHLDNFFRAAEQAGKALEVAIAIGVDPVLLLSSQALAPLGFDEFTIASTLYGEPLKLVKCETVDLEVPAEAEIVLEGHIMPGTREIEGPFGEYPKYYGPPTAKPVVALTAMTTRRNPIYHTIVPATLEHLLIGSIAREGGMLEVIRGAVPNTLAVHLTPGGTCRYHAVVQIDKKHEGEAKNAMLAAFASSQEIKRVVVVDKDVDIFDPVEVEWAIATRFQAGRDCTIITRALGSKLDPSGDDGISDKMGFDATVPLGADPFRYERIRIPGEEDIDLDSYFD